jgi:hypothetical protein
MNNSFIAIENVSLATDEVRLPLQALPQLRAKETELIAIIDAIVRLNDNPDWLLLKEKVWDGVVDSIYKRRNSEVEKKPLNGPVIHGLNGQLEWAKKYSNILDLARIYKQELENIRKKLYEGKE